MSSRPDGPILLANHHASEPGGADLYIQYLAVGLAESGFRVVLSWPRDHPLLPSVREERVRRLETIFLDYPAPRDRRFRFAWSFINPLAVRQMRRLCNDLSPPVIHVNQAFEGDGIDLIRAALGDGTARVFGTIHLQVNPPTANRWFARGKGALMKPFFRRFPYGKIFPSQRQLERFVGVYGNQGCLRWIPNGIVLPPVASAEDAHERKIGLGLSARTVIAYSGRISEGKGIEILTAAFLEARKIHSDLFLLVIGDGPLRPTMERKLSREAGRGDWLVTGWTSRVSDYLAAADMLVLPSQFETGGPLSVLEALSMGIPCLCTPYDGVDELLARGAPLVVVEKRDVHSVTQGIVGTLDLPGQTRERINRTLDAMRGEFDCRKMAQKTAGIYFERPDDGAITC